MWGVGNLVATAPCGPDACVCSRARPHAELDDYQRFEGPVANIKQQVKRNRKNEEARQRNKAVKSRIKTAIRRYRETLEAGDTAAADERRREAGRLLDKAVSKGVIHKNQAANKKSRMAHRAERFTVDAKAGKTPA
jgi:small subunit ribosomal protein S20